MQFPETVTFLQAFSMWLIGHEEFKFFFYLCLGNKIYQARLNNAVSRTFNIFCKHIEYEEYSD